MNRIRLKIRCWKCGREELIVELYDEKVVEVNLDKQCPVCRNAWMTRSEMMIEKR
jgi:Zn-finger nucleic acid-binding protein